jgi:hypothetical protein
MFYCRLGVFAALGVGQALEAQRSLVQDSYLMYSVDVLEQGARSNTALRSDVEYFQWEKFGIAEGWREKSCYGRLKRT